MTNAEIEEMVERAGRFGLAPAIQIFGVEYLRQDLVEAQFFVIFGELLRTIMPEMTALSTTRDQWNRLLREVNRAEAE